MLDYNIINVQLSAKRPLVVCWEQVYSNVGDHNLYCEYYYFMFLVAPLCSVIIIKGDSTHIDQKPFYWLRDWSRQRGCRTISKEVESKESYQSFLPSDAQIGA